MSLAANTDCGGGWTENAYGYIINNGGIETEEAYPYTGEVWTSNQWTRE